jgi:hypothetical protein
VKVRPAAAGGSGDLADAIARVDSVRRQQSIELILIGVGLLYLLYLHDAQRRAWRDERGHWAFALDTAIGEVDRLRTQWRGREHDVPDRPGESGDSPGET